MLLGDTGFDENESRHLIKKTMTQQTQKQEVYTQFFIEVAVLIGIFFFICLGLRIEIIDPNMDYQDVCKLEYGDNWKYEYNEVFGSTCVIMDFISLEVTDRKLINLTNEEINEKYCKNPPKFFDLTRWDNGCIKK